jgi:hypothetical protein
VRLVDRHQRRAQLREPLERAADRQPLGRDVDHAVAPLEEPALALSPLLGRHRGRQERRRDPALCQAAHLIFHQRDQRRDDDARPLEHRGGELVAERLSAAGRRDHQRAARAHEDLLDRLELPRPERREPEAIAQRLLEIAELLA